MLNLDTEREEVQGQAQVSSLAKASQKSLHPTPMESPAQEAPR